VKFARFASIYDLPKPIEISPNQYVRDLSEFSKVRLVSADLKKPHITNKQEMAMKRLQLSYQQRMLAGKFEIPEPKIPIEVVQNHHDDKHTNDDDLESEAYEAPSERNRRASRLVKLKTRKEDESLAFALSQNEHHKYAVKSKSRENVNKEAVSSVHAFRYACAYTKILLFIVEVNVFTFTFKGNVCNLQF
jgi:hypothetical protein